MANVLQRHYVETYSAPKICHAPLALANWIGPDRDAVLETLYQRKRHEKCFGQIVGEIGAGL